MQEVILVVGFIFLVLSLYDCVSMLRRIAGAQERIAASLEIIGDTLEVLCVDDEDAGESHVTRIVNAQEKLADINPPMPKE